MRKTLFLILFCGCTTTTSDPEMVNQIGQWQMSWHELVTPAGSYTPVEMPTTDYSDRVATFPGRDPSACSPGCACEMQAAVADCHGDIGYQCEAVGRFVETCHIQQTYLECYLNYDRNDHGSGVCSLRPITNQASDPELARYWLDVTRVSR